MISRRPFAKVSMRHDKQATTVSSQFGRALDCPGRPFTSRWQYVPEPGMMLVFPSRVTHYVHPHDGLDERISSAFNARIVSMRQAPKRIWRR